MILLIDYSESMLEELPVVKAAARQFARALLRPQDRLAVVGFNQRTFWLTGYTNDWNAAAQAVDRVQPIGETHLYDSVIEMLYELQKTPGRHALVVLTDGVDQGSRFKLDHLVHYARYAGVPVYPVVKNKSLSRWMKLGVGRLQARRARPHRRGHRRDVLHHPERARARRRLRPHRPRSCASSTSSSSTPRPTSPTSGARSKVASTAGHKLRAPKGYFP